jgi:hypothetical protein
MKTQEFKQILAEVKNMDIPAESAVQVATVILQESGKDRRGEVANAARMNGNSNNNGSDKPASQKQIKYLQALGVPVEQRITSKKASELIEANKGKGRNPARPFQK